MDEYPSSDPEMMMALERGRLPMVRYATWLLWGLVSLDVLGFLGTLAGAVAMGATADDPTTPEVIGQIVGIGCSGLMLLVFSIPQAVAAWGLGRGAKWAWILTIVLGGLYVLSCCPGLLFGGALLFFMLNEEVRLTFQEA